MKRDPVRFLLRARLLGAHGNPITCGGDVPEIPFSAGLACDRCMRTRTLRELTKVPMPGQFFPALVCAGCALPKRRNPYADTFDAIIDSGRWRDGREPDRPVRP